MVDAANYNKQTALHIVCLCDNVARQNHFSGVSVGADGRSTAPPQLRRQHQCRWFVIDLMIAMSINTRPDNDGNSPLHICALTSHERCASV
jgi:ankyrin repeat protein